MTCRESAFARPALPARAASKNTDAGRAYSGEAAIEVGISAIDDEVLSGCVGRLSWRQKEDSHRGDLRSFCHAMAQRNAVGNSLQSAGGVVAGVEPTLVERRQNLGGENAVHTDPKRQKLRSPLAGERQLRSFGGGIGGSSALTREGDLGADVDDRTAVFLQEG